MSQELIAKYEIWIERLEQNIDQLVRQRRTFRMMFIGAAVISAVGFFFGVWIGVATFFTGIMVCTAGLYITMTREWEYERELKRMRAEVVRLRQDDSKNRAK
jgi:hypothetical protein